MTEKSIATGYVKSNMSLLLTKLLKSLIDIRTGLVLLTLLILLAVAGTIFWATIYQTLFFRSTIGLLCLTLTLGNLVRITVLWYKTFRLPLLPPAMQDSWPVCWQCTVLTTEQKFTILAQAALKSQGLRLHFYESSIYAVKGRLSLWGALAVHFAILLIIAGALYGQFYGFSTDVTVPVGSIFQLDHTLYPRLSAPIHIKLKRFTIDYYKDGTVSDWISDISLECNGQERLHQEIKVNHPLRYEGLMIYQLSYGNLIHTQVLGQTGTLKKEINVKERDILRLDKKPGLAIQPLRISDSNCVNYVIYDHNEPVVWSNIPLGKPFKIGNNQGSVCFTAVTPFSVLRIKQDPGIPYIWSGFFLLILGIFLSLYFCHIEIWLTVTSTNQGTVVKLGSPDARSSPVTETVFKEIMAGQTELLKKGPS